MDSNWQSPGGPKGSGYYATSAPQRDLEEAWGSSGAPTVAPPESPGPPKPPQPPQPPQPPHPPVAVVAPTSPDVALPRPAPFSAKRSPWISPWRLRGPEARRQFLLAGTFVVLAVLAALVVAASLSKDADPGPSRVAAGPGGPNPFARTDDPVPALTENDSVLPPADAAQLPPDPNAAATTAAPAQAGQQATSTPLPVGGAAPSASPNANPFPAPQPAKSVTLVYSATPSDITINGNDSPKLNVGDRLVLKRASGEAGGIAVAAPGTFVESRSGYDYTYTVLVPGTYSVTVVAFGLQKSVPVTVG